MVARKSLAEINWTDFEKVEMRVGTIVKAVESTGMKKPSYQLWIDFGELGVKKSSAQITKLYNKDELLGKQVVAVVNFPPKQIGTFMSECLVLGAVDGDKVVLIGPYRKTDDGLRVG